MVCKILNVLSNVNINGNAKELEITCSVLSQLVLL